MKATTEELLQRELWRCMRCGCSLAGVSASRHHRQRRRVGPDTPSNLILLCGSGTTGCHGWVHHHPVDAREQGWIVSAFAPDPAAVPVWSHQWSGLVLLDDDYGVNVWTG